MNRVTHYLNLSGRKDFPFIVVTASGRAVAYFKNSKDAEAWLNRGMA